jgi:2-oxoglutarate dehydrogenase E2 component (dihydrolipoamide succinyltransferase)
MGESIAEGTVSRWMKKVGDEVTRDEPLLEISTDKVDAEIPSPAAGTLVEISVEEGQTVEVGTVVGFIETEKGAAASTPSGDGDDGASAKAKAKSEPAEDGPAAKGGQADAPAAKAAQEEPVSLPACADARHRWSVASRRSTMST